VSTVRIARVLCPVDLSAISSREVDMGIEVCRAFGARLRLHHCLAETAPGLAKSWEWKREHHAEAVGEPEALERLRELMERLPADLRAEAGVSRGPVAATLVALARALPADLLILGTHGEGSEDHSSVTERIVARCPCPVLALHENGGPPFHLRATAETGGARSAVALVPTDFSATAEAAVAYAFALARTVPLELHLLHVLPGRHGDAVGATAACDAAFARLSERVPDDLHGRVACHCLAGHAADEILALVDRLRPTFIAMGEHTSGWFQRALTRDTARAILDRAACPVWFVPPTWRGH
jgi:nucleotide-binding universal stress UspA family protein